NSSALAISKMGNVELINLNEEAFREVKPRQNAVAVTQRILNSNPERLSGRIYNALEHFALAQVATAPKVQLVNLWSAVECLAGTSKGTSVINTVCDSIVPILLCRRAEKILRYTARMLKEWRDSGVTSPLGPGFPPPPSKTIPAEC